MGLFEWLFGKRKAGPSVAPAAEGRASAETRAGAPSQDPTALYQEGMHLFEQGKFKDAAAILEKAQTLLPNSAPVQFTLAVTCSRISGECRTRDRVSDETILPWDRKCAEAFKKALSLGRQYGGFKEQQLATARDATVAYDRILAPKSQSVPSKEPSANQPLPGGTMADIGGIRVTCPNGHKLRVKPALAGKRVRCPKKSCGAVIDVASARASKAQKPSGSATTKAPVIGQALPLLDREPEDVLALELHEASDSGDIWKAPSWQEFLKLANTALSSRNADTARAASGLLDAIERSLENHSIVWLWRGLIARASSQPEAKAREVWGNGLLVCPRKTGLSKEIGLSFLEEHDVIRGTAWLLVSSLIAQKKPYVSSDDSEGWVYLATIADLLGRRRVAASLFCETDVRKQVRLNQDEVARLRLSVNRLNDDQRRRLNDLLTTFCTRIKLLPPEFLPSAPAERSLRLVRMRNSWMYGTPAVDLWSESIRINVTN